MSTYTTKQGDMFDSIAFEQYGTETAMTQLLLANQNYADIYLFPAGVVLTLPEIEQAASGTQAPPWKQVAG